MTELLTTMKQRLADAESDAQRLREAIKALEAADTPKASTATTTTRRAQTTKPAASPTVVPVGKLLDLLKGTDGLTTRELAKQTGGQSSAILHLLKEQETDGNVRRTGQKAATRWHLITDEDRIVTRTAEPAAKTRRRR